MVDPKSGVAQPSGPFERQMLAKQAVNRIAVQSLPALGKTVYGHEFAASRQGVCQRPTDSYQIGRPETRADFAQHDQIERTTGLLGRQIGTAYRDVLESGAAAPRLLYCAQSHIGRENAFAYPCQLDGQFARRGVSATSLFMATSCRRAAQSIVGIRLIRRRHYCRPMDDSCCGRFPTYGV